MISCSNCGKSIAEDAVHCGHCGHKIERTTNQKTMMGFALSPEDLQRAIAEAGQQRSAQAGQPAQPDPSAQPEMYEGLDEPFDDSLDGMANTIMLPSIHGNMAFSDTLDPESEMAAEAAKVAEEHAFGSSPAMPEPGQINAPAAGFGASLSPSSQDPFAQSAGSVNQPLAPTPQANLQTMPGDQGGQEGEESFVQKNKKMLIIGGIVAGLLFGCCILGVIFRFVL